jgi:hypothetical protein
MRLMVVLGDAVLVPWPGYALVRLPAAKSTVWYQARLLGAVRLADRSRKRTLDI